METNIKSILISFMFLVNMLCLLFIYYNLGNVLFTMGPSPKFHVSVCDCTRIKDFISKSINNNFSISSRDAIILQKYMNT